MSMNIVTQQDMSYLIQQSPDNMSMILSGMTALMSENFDKIEILQNQNWFQNLSNTISGKNKMTRYEIQQNCDIVNIYLTEAISELYNNQCIDKQIMMSLTNQLNEIYSGQIQSNNKYFKLRSEMYEENENIKSKINEESTKLRKIVEDSNIQLKKMLGNFVNALNEKIESIDNFHLLNAEIQQGVYSDSENIISICKILSQIDKNCIKDFRKMNFLQRTLKTQNILNDEQVLIKDYLLSIAQIPADLVGYIYLELSTLRGNLIADIILSMMENYHFLPDLTRKLKNIDVIIDGIITAYQLNSSISLSISEIYENFINTKLDKMEGYITVESLSDDERLYSATQVLQHWLEVLEENIDAVCEQESLTHAVETFKELAEAGNMNAMYQLGLCCLDGYGINRDRTKAFKCFQTAANFGNEKAKFQLAECYLYGFGTESDENKSYELYKELAESGNEEAKFQLATCYFYGQGIEENTTKAFRIYKDLANLGNIRAKQELADCYFYGWGTEENGCKAFNLYKELVEYNNNAYVMFQLGNCYKNEEDWNEAIKYYQKSAELDCDEAKLALADCYYYGRGTEENNEKAFELYLELAEQGGIIVITHRDEIMCQLGYCYKNGYGTDVNLEEAFNCFQEAVESGSKDAKFELANCFYFGKGTEEDNEQAFELYLELAEEENSTYDRAMCQLGYCYKYGYGVEKNIDQAIQWFLKASNLGNENAENEWRRTLSENLSAMKEEADELVRLLRDLN